MCTNCAHERYRPKRLDDADKAVQDWGRTGFAGDGGKRQEARENEERTGERGGQEDGRRCGRGQGWSRESGSEVGRTTSGAFEAPKTVTCEGLLGRLRDQSICPQAALIVGRRDNRQ
ncbi:hypothetical protein FOMPIDRAFT_95294 [Fomitopsis schrenkii]|uniref:Uncharacterized protein n=1 Tax=Fomitopsis schrenkii TaxID=2126942 RepID=S8DT80_FOMSC|nr:hypothetical protein FOMPIDRAFT_95294 [Fomitopsis schrenkii]